MSKTTHKILKISKLSKTYVKNEQVKKKIVQKNKAHRLTANITLFHSNK